MRHITLDQWDIWSWTNETYDLGTMRYMTLDQWDIWSWNNETYDLGTMRHMILDQWDIWPWTNETYDLGPMRYMTLNQWDILPWTNETYYLWPMRHMTLDQWDIWSWNNETYGIGPMRHKTLDQWDIWPSINEIYYLGHWHITLSKASCQATLWQKHTWSSWVLVRFITCLITCSCGEDINFESCYLGTKHQSKEQFSCAIVVYLYCTCMFTITTFKDRNYCLTHGTLNTGCLHWAHCLRIMHSCVTVVGR